LSESRSLRSATEAAAPVGMTIQGTETRFSFPWVGWRPMDTQGRLFDSVPCGDCAQDDSHMEVKLSSHTQRSFAAFGTIEENPGYEVLGEVHEAMNLARRNKQYVPALEDDFLLAPEKASSSARDNIDFVTSVGLLGTGAVGSVEFDAEGSVLEQFDKALALGTGQADHTVVNSEVSLHNSPPYR